VSVRSRYARQMESSEGGESPNAAQDIVLKPVPANLTISMGTPTVTVEAVAAAADKGLRLGWAASYLGLGVSVLGASAGFLSTIATSANRVFVLILAVVLLPFVATVTVLGIDELFLRRIKWKNSVKKASLDPSVIRDQVIRRLVEDIAAGGPYSVNRGGEGYLAT